MVSIGIESDWGNGKTKFVKKIEKFISNDFIIIHLELLNEKSTEQIVNIVSEKILSKIKEQYDNDFLIIPSQLKIIKSIDNLNQLIYGLKELVSNQEFNELDDTIEKINDILEFYNVRLLIIIDDLDRLQKNEIIQLFSIIRNTLKLNKTKFLICYSEKQLNTIFNERNSEGNNEIENPTGLIVPLRP